MECITRKWRWSTHGAAMSGLCVGGIFIELGSRTERGNGMETMSLSTSERMVATRLGVPLEEIAAMKRNPIVGKALHGTDNSGKPYRPDRQTDRQARNRSCGAASHHRFRTRRRNLMPRLAADGLPSRGPWSSPRIATPRTCGIQRESSAGRCGHFSNRAYADGK